MERYERIIALHRQLQAAHRPITVARLQDELACSRATVYRDIAFLRDALMAPVVGDGEAGFAYDKAESERFELPGLWLNSERPAGRPAIARTQQRRHVVDRLGAAATARGKIAGRAFGWQARADAAGAGDPASWPQHG